MDATGSVAERVGAAAGGSESGDLGPITQGTSRSRAVDARWAKVLPYPAAAQLQSELVRARRGGEIPDQLILLEHPHVITLGSRSDRSHVLVDATERVALGIDLVESGRGGDVTYHGPGQLVGYPILDLKPDRKDIHRYLRDLEEVLIRVARAYGISAERIPESTGVWTNAGKLGAIGVRISSGWITSHGFALNVTTDLSYFDRIVPVDSRQGASRRSSSCWVGASRCWTSWKKPLRLSATCSTLPSRGPTIPSNRELAHDARRCAENSPWNRHNLSCS